MKTRIALGGTSDKYILFWCPGCKSSHGPRVEGEPGRPMWTWNGEREKPTFQPSILVTYNGPDAGETDDEGDRAPPAICHSFVTDGQIQFLGDSTHALAGQTVEIPEWPRPDWGGIEEE